MLKKLWHRDRYFVAFIVSGCLLVIFGVFVLWKVFFDPEIPFVYSEHGARWIRHREPTTLKVRFPETTRTIFRAHVFVGNPSDRILFHFKAMKSAEVLMNGEVLYALNQEDIHTWKRVRTIDLTEKLSPGLHEIKVIVYNTNAHPALLAYAPSLGLITNETWETSVDGTLWGRARPVDEEETLLLARRFPRTDRAFRENMSTFIPLFVVTLFLYLAFRQKGLYSGTFVIRPGTVRWAVIALWVILSLNNIGKIPLRMGMDIDGHMEYIRYIIDHARIPLPSEGWQTFQPPLFYILAAGIYKACSTIFSPENLDRAMRVIPLVCGGLQIELCYRVLRDVYPDRDGLQTAGILFSGFLPMNIYISQCAGNEPLAAFFSVSLW